MRAGTATIQADCRPDTRRVQTGCTTKPLGAPRLDGRTRSGRLHRDLVAKLTAELGPNLSEIDKLRIVNAASWQVLVADLTERLAAGEDVDLTALQRTMNAADRVLERLRKHRAAKKPARGGNAVADYLATKRDGVDA